MERHASRLEFWIHRPRIEPSPAPPDRTALNHHFPSERALADSAAKAAPWWIAIGVTGVSIALLSGSAPLLASLALIGIGSDADLGRRMREAVAAEGDPAGFAPVAGLIRRVHAAMYALLIVLAWASLMHLASQSSSPLQGDRLWLAADLFGASVIASGYARLVRRRPE